MPACLAEKAGLEARFVEGNVYHAPEIVGADFDLVYTTWGTTVWLPDIRGWAKAVAACLRPGGRFYYADTHPSLAVLEEVDGKLTPTFNFRTPSTVPLEFAAGPTYTGDPRVLTGPSFEWIHPLSDILNALIDAGLMIEWVHEHEGLPFQMLPMMVRGRGPAVAAAGGRPAPAAVGLDQRGQAELTMANCLACRRLLSRRP